jgi:hypothetical protein
MKKQDQSILSSIASFATENLQVKDAYVSATSTKYDRIFLFFDVFTK